MNNEKLSTSVECDITGSIKSKNEPMLSSDIINEKQCRHCNIIKPIVEYTKDKNRKDGHYCYCKQCNSTLRKELYLKNVYKYIERSLKYYHNPANKEKIQNYYNKTKSKKKLRYKFYRQNNVEKIRNTKRKYKQKLFLETRRYIRNPICVLHKICNKCKIDLPIEQFNKSSYHKDGHKSICKRCRIPISKKYVIFNHDKIKKNAKEYRIKNRKIISQRRMERMKVDLNFKVACRLRSIVSTNIKKYKGKKSIKTEILLGCKFKEFIYYMESKFTHGMTWDNYGKWHIDHIIPCSSFDLTNIEEQKKCFHYTNQQPLWAIDNLKKGNRMLP